MEKISIDIKADELDRFRGLSEELDNFIDKIDNYWKGTTSRIGTIYAGLNKDEQPTINFVARFSWKQK